MPSTKLLLHFGSSSGSMAMQFGISLLAARQLGPADLGVFGAAAAVAAVAHAIRDLGISSHLQQRACIGPADLSAALGLSWAGSLAAALLLPGFAGVLVPGAEAQRETLTMLLRVLSLGLLVVPVGAVGTALALRADDAHLLARVTVWGSVAHALAALGLLAAGAGVMALAWAQVVNLGVCSLVHGLLWPRELRVRPGLGGWPDFLRTGRATVPASLLNALLAASAVLLLTRLVDSTQAGLLGRAQTLVALLPGLAAMAMQFGAIGRLARIHQGRRSLAPSLLRGIRGLTRWTWPLLAACSVLAGPLIELLFGHRWRPAEIAVPVLALLSAQAMCFNEQPAALAAIGRPGLAMLPVLLGLVARLVLAALGWMLLPELAVRHPLGLFCLAMLLAGGLTLPCQLWIAGRYLGLRPWTLARTLAPAARLSAGVALAMMTVRLVVGSRASAGLTVAAACGCASALLLMSWRSACRTRRRKIPASWFQSEAMSPRRRITIRK